MRLGAKGDWLAVPCRLPPASMQLRSAPAQWASSWSGSGAPKAMSLAAHLLEHLEGCYEVLKQQGHHFGVKCLAFSPGAVSLKRGKALATNEARPEERSSAIGGRLLATGLDSW